MTFVLCVLPAQAGYISKGAPNAFDTTDFIGLMLYFFFLPAGCTCYLILAQASMKHASWDLTTRIQLGCLLSLLAFVAGVALMMQYGKLFTTITTPFISYTGQATPYGAVTPFVTL